MEGGGVLLRFALMGSWNARPAMRYAKVSLYAKG